MGGRYRVAPTVRKVSCRLPRTDVGGLFRTAVQSVHGLQPQLVTTGMEVDLSSVGSGKLE